MKTPISVSGIPRLKQCPGSIKLPQLKDRTTSPAAERGTKIHDDIRISILGGPDTADSLAVKKAIPEAVHGLPEVMMSFTPGDSTGQIHEIGVGSRNYEAFGVIDDRTIYGTADLIIEKPLTVVDYKTGITDYGPPAESTQLRSYALSFMLANKIDLSTPVRLVYCYIDEESIVELDEATVTDMETHRTLLAELLEIAKDSRVLNPGPECRYCAAKRYCPAVELAGAWTKSENLTVTETNAAAWLNWLEVAKSIFYDVEEQLKTMASENGLKLGDGTMYSKGSSTRRDIVGKSAAEVLRANGVDVDEFLKVSYSKLKSLVPPGQVDKLLTELSGAGAVTQSTYARYTRKKC